MKNKVSEGIVAALWSPTDAEGHLIKSALKSNIDFLKKSGINAILALGSTGEFLRLDLAERKRLVEHAIKYADGLPVMVNITDTRPVVVTDLGKFAEKAGAAGVALMAPCFYPLSQTDMAEWFVRAAERINLPFFLYNFPERTGCRIGPETVAAVADRVSVAGIKQSGAEFEYHRELIKLGREKNFKVFTGSDTRIAEAMRLGADGCIGGLANGIPDLMAHMFRAIKHRDTKQVQFIGSRISEVGEKVGRLEFPLNVAALMEAREQRPGYPKLPVSSETKARYAALVKDLRSLFKSWGLPAPGSTINADKQTPRASHLQLAS